MKKTTVKSNKRNTVDPNKYLVEGASMLVKMFHTPVNFLDFLTQALYWHDQALFAHGAVGDKSDTYPIQVMIRYIIRPWIEENEADKRLKKIQEGIHALVDFTGYENYNKCFATIAVGFGIDLSNSNPFEESCPFEECPDPKGEIKHPFLYLHCMRKVGGILESYEKINFPGNVGIHGNS